MLTSTNGPKIAIDIETDAFVKDSNTKMSIIDEIMHQNNGYASCCSCTMQLSKYNFNDKKTAQELYDSGIINETEYNKLMAYEKTQGYYYEPGVSPLFPDQHTKIEMPKLDPKSPEFYEQIEHLIKEANEIHRQTAEFTKRNLIDDREQIKQHYEKELEQARKVITELSGQIVTLTKDNE